MICWGSSCLLHSFKTSFLQVFFTVLAWFSGIEDKTNADKFDKHLWLDTTNGQWWRTGYFYFHYELGVYFIHEQMCHSKYYKSRLGSSSLESVEPPLTLKENGIKLAQSILA